MAMEARDAVHASGVYVTLIVYGWKVVEPGTLWWVCPSVAAATNALPSPLAASDFANHNLFTSA